MNEKKLIEYYNKFNEEKRLLRRHGNVEYITSMKYIHEYLKEFNNPKIIDIGAGCGIYSIALSREGYDVTAIELVKHNLRVIEKKSNRVKAYQGNALDLSRFSSNSFDFTLLFGPMYHLCTKEEKLKALNEAKRITKIGGIIMVAYCMNDYCIIKHGFRDNFIKDALKSGNVDANYHVVSKEDDLYSVVRLEEIDELNNLSHLERIKIIAPDGAANYMRDILNKMDAETYQKFIEYNLSICERKDMIGASAHTVDILRKLN